MVWIHEDGGTVWQPESKASEFIPKKEMDGLDYGVGEYGTYDKNTGEVIIEQPTKLDLSTVCNMLSDKYGGVWKLNDKWEFVRQDV